MEYLFENKEKKPFFDLPEKTQALIVKHKQKGEVEQFVQNYTWYEADECNLHFDSIYRVKAKPYTIEDAREEILSAFSSISHMGGQPLTKEEIVRRAFDKLAASMEGK